MSECNGNLLNNSVSFGRMLLALGVLFFAGCDTTGQYNQRVIAAANNAGGGGGGGGKGGLVAQDWPVGNPVVGQIRVPKLFEAQKTLQAEPRAKPPFLNFPGFLYSYEVAWTADKRKLPVYAYVGAVPVAGQNIDQLVGKIKEEINAGITDVDLQDFAYGPQTLTSGATPQPFARVIAIGPQMFNGQEVGGADEQLKGKFDLYIHQTATRFILIGWRFPMVGNSAGKLGNDIEAAMMTFRPDGGG